MVGIDGTLGSLTAITHRAGVTENNELVTTSTPEGLAVARGLIPGITAVNKFGASPDVDNNQITDLWDFTAGSIYNYQTSGIPLYMVSTAIPDSPTIQIQGLNERGEQTTVSQQVTSGRTPVLIGSDIGSTFLWYRVFRGLITSATPQFGNISIYESGTVSTGVVDDRLKVKAYLSSGTFPANQTRMALYTIPSGKTGYIKSLYGNLVNNTAAVIDYKLFIRPSGGVFNIKYESVIDSNANSTWQHTYSVPLKIEPLSDIKINVRSDTTNTAVAGGFDIIIVNGS